jgi:ABC-type multidrug transport system fused ATPase/permease subunit
MPKYLKYYKDTLLLICQKDKVYLTLSILRIIINSIRPFPGMLLIKEITKMLTENYNPKAYLYSLIPLLLLVMMTEVLYSIINSVYTRRKNLFCMKLKADITTKSMTMDYENI